MLMKIKNDKCVIDMFLFVNPLDTYCHCAVNRLITAFSNSSIKLYCHIIPYQNKLMLDKYIQEHNLRLSDLNVRYQIEKTASSVMRLFKAATFQGKKKARLFLYYLNQFTKEFNYQLTTDMFLLAAQKANLDSDMLFKDSSSERVDKLIEKDIHMAQKYNIAYTPSVIVFDSSHMDGILIENTLSVETILLALQTTQQSHVH